VGDESRVDAREFVRTSYVMKLLPTLALAGLLAACAVQPPDPDVHAATVHEVQPGAFRSVHSMYFQTVDDGATYMQQLVEHVPVDHPDRITAAVDR